MELVSDSSEPLYLGLVIHRIDSGRGPGDSFRLLLLRVRPDFPRKRHIVSGSLHFNLVRIQKRGALKGLFNRSFDFSSSSLRFDGSQVAPPLHSSEEDYCAFGGILLIPSFELAR